MQAQKGKVEDSPNDNARRTAPEMQRSQTNDNSLAVKPGLEKNIKGSSRSEVKRHEAANLQSKFPRKESTQVR